MDLVKSRNRKKTKEKVDPIAVEISRLAQGTPVVGYHDEDGYLVIPKEYDDGYDSDGPDGIRVNRSLILSDRRI